MRDMPEAAARMLRPHEATDENGETVVICYECAEEHKIPFEDEGAEEN